MTPKAEVLLCQLTMTMRTARCTVKRQIDELRKTHEIDMEEPSDKHQTKILLAEPQTKLKQMMKQSKEERRKK